MGTRQNNLIIPVEYLDRALPEDSNDQDGRETDAITRATTFVNTWAVHYLPFDGYTSTEPSSNEDDDTTYTINAPHEIAQICTQVAIAMYKLNTDEVIRNAGEREFWTNTLEGYKEELRMIEIEPVEYTLTVNLDTEGYQEIARNENIIPWNAWIVSGSTNVWNLGEHFYIRKGPLDEDDYRWESWYLDGSNEKDDLEGTLHYYRSFRRDTKDYMKTYKYRWTNN